MVRVALVEYINTRPFLDGLTQYFEEDEIRLNLLPPADCARALRHKEVDLALFPVGALPNFEGIHLLPDYCIGANGPVASVFLFSQVPVHQLDKVILDRHSRSSNGLARILMTYHWQRSVVFELPTDKHFDQIRGNTGGVVIGDQAIRLKHTYKYAYDLSDHWWQLTGLPFVFAVWGYHPEHLPESALKKLNEAMAWGVSHGAESAQRWAKHYRIEESFALTYLQEHIDFRFTAGKHRALSLFLKTLTCLPQLSLQRV